MAYVDINATRLWVEEAGRGTAIVFSHSLFFDATMFAAQMAAFAGSHRVIAYDHRGQGRSEPGQGPPTLDLLTEDAAALIEALGANPCHFVGNSLGGFVALRLAARRPELLLSCTVLGSSGTQERQTEAFTPLVDGLAQTGAAPHVDMLMHVMFGDDFLADPDRHDERSHWRARIAALSPSIADSARAVVNRTAILQELSGCRVPVLAVAGGQDHVYDADDAARIAEATHGRAETIGDGGHSLALERPEQVNALLRTHMQAAGQGAGLS